MTCVDLVNVIVYCFCCCCYFVVLVFVVVAAVAALSFVHFGAQDL